MSSKTRLKGLIFLALMAAVLLSGWGCTKSEVSRYYPAKVDDDDNWSLVDLQGNIIVDKEWKNQPSMETEGMVFVSDKDGRYQFYQVGKAPKKIGKDYESVTNFSEGLAAVVAGKDDSKYIQYIDRNGNVKIDLKKKLGGKKITGASRFNEGLARVKSDDGKYGFINKKGELVVKFSYDYADLFYDGLARVSKSGDDESRSGFINKKGEEVIKLKEGRNYSRFSEGYCWFSVDGEDRKWGTIDRKGNEVIKPTKDIQGAQPFRKGISVFTDGEAYGLVDTKGKEILRPKYDQLFRVETGIVAINNEKWGVIDTKGKEIFPFTDDYDMLIPVKGGKFLLREKDKFLFADKKGKETGKNRFENFSMDGIMGMQAAESFVEYYDAPVMPEFNYDDY